MTKPECDNQCTIYFPGMPSLWGSCQKYCDRKTDFTKCDFLENVVGDVTSIQYYGLDCDPTKGQGSKLFQQQTDNANYSKKVMIAVITIIVALFVLWIFLK